MKGWYILFVAEGRNEGNAAVCETNSLINIQRIDCSFLTILKTGILYTNNVL